MDLRIGTSGFQFEGWKPAVYPYRLKKSEMFDYYCRELGFDCLELNAPFYRLPNPKAMESLARRAPDGFTFIVKIHHLLTHQNVGRAYSSGAGSQPAQWRAWVCPLYNGEQPPSRLLSRLFYRALQPIQESGKLRGVLAQFPPSFIPGQKNFDHLKFLKEEAGAIPLFVEFRHRRWTRASTFDFLRKEEIGYCSADLPRLGNLPPFVLLNTTRDAYLRLHGRSPDWFRDPRLRYRYSYSDQELAHFVTSARRRLPGADRVYIFFNNCHAGAAIRNAKRARAFLSLAGVPMASMSMPALQPRSEQLPATPWSSWEKTKLPANTGA